MIGKKHDLGQNLVEFAITLPFLLLIIMMIFDLGRVIYYFSAINHAAHEGVRYGAVIYENTEEKEQMITDRVKDSAIGIGDAIVVENPCICFDSYDRARLWIGVNYSFAPVTPVVGSFLGSGQTIDLDFDSSMMVEHFIGSSNSSQYTACSICPPE